MSIHETSRRRSNGERLKRGRSLRYSCCCHARLLETPDRGAGRGSSTSGLDEADHINKGLRLARSCADLNELGLPTARSLSTRRLRSTPGICVLGGHWRANTETRCIGSEWESALLDAVVGFKNARRQPRCRGRSSSQSDRTRVSPVTVKGLGDFQTDRNAACHVKLRGGSRSGPKLATRQIERVCNQLSRRALGTVMVDCSPGTAEDTGSRRRGGVTMRQVGSGSRTSAA